MTESPRTSDLTEEEAIRKDREETRNECKDMCVKRLPKEERELILRYVTRKERGESEVEIAKENFEITLNMQDETVEKIAKAFEIKTVNALRQKINHIRSKLDKCFVDCLKKHGLFHETI